MVREISIVPSRFQVPVMLVLAVVFVALLVCQSKRLSARRARVDEVAVAVVSSPGEEVAAPKVSLEDVRVLMKELQSAAVEPHEAVTEPPPLIRDPFHLRVLPVRTVDDVVAEAPGTENADPAAGTDVGAGDVEPEERPGTETAAASTDESATDVPGPAAPEDEGAAVRRLRFLASLTLSATCITDDGAVALVNGRIMRQGDTIGDFAVKAIRARDIVLEDDAGPVVVPIQEALGP